MAKLKIGVFGAHRGIALIDVLLAYPEAQLVAVCDRHLPSLERTRKRAEKAGMETALYENFEDFIKHDMDAVVLANYATEHATYAVRCLDRGLHVLSECLPCETMAQADELVEAVERSGKVYSFAENCCYMAHAWEMWQKYEEGTLGEVTYAECEYLHDCSNIWPRITYGDPNHWRNLMHPNFYCTHSLGPIIAATGKRPVQVVGFETPRRERSYEEAGVVIGGGVEMVTLEGGAVVKSIHGGFTREAANRWNFMIYCQNGMMETARFPEQKNFNMYTEGEKLCVGTWDRYDPVIEIAREHALKAGKEGHGGADFYAPYFFIKKILGHEDGKWSIDVYQALDMCIPGILAYRSVLAGNTPIKIPNMRNPEEREAWRHDNACTNPAVAGDLVLPVSSYPYEPVSEEIYKKMEKLFLENRSTNGDEGPKLN